MKNKNTAALFALFLGAFGVHKFYLRDPGSGIFYIMLTIFSSSLGFPLGTILGVIDAFAMFTMSEERFDKKYNSGTRNTRTQSRQSRRDDRFERRSTSRRSKGRTPNERTTRATRTNRTNRTAEERPSRSHYENQKRRKNIIKDNPFKISGIKRLKDFELDLAQADLTRALELSPDDNEIHFSLGKLYSLEEQKHKSFYHLKKAIDLGFADVSQIKSTDELAYLRIQDEFEEFQNSGYRVVPGSTQTSDSSETTNTNTNQAKEPPKDDLLQDDLLLSQLNKLQELRKKGLLSEKEFQQEKVKLIGR